MEIYLKYYTKDKNERTTADKLEDAEQYHLIPDFYLPDHSLYVWDWFWEFAGAIDRGDSGIYRRAPWSEFLAWSKALGHIVRQDEYAILQEMDVLYCNIRSEQHRVMMESNKTS